MLLVYVHAISILLFWYVKPKDLNTSSSIENGSNDDAATIC